MAECSNYRERLFQFPLVVLGQPTVQLRDLHLLPDPGLVQLLLQHLVLELEVLLERHQLVLEVDPLQRLVLEVPLAVLELVLQPGVVWLQGLELGLGVVGASQGFVVLALNGLELAVGGRKQLVLRRQILFGLSSLAAGLLGLDLQLGLLLGNLETKSNRR